MNSLTQQLAAYVVQPVFGNDEQAALAVANTGFIDTVGTMLAGSHEPVVQIMLKHAGVVQTPGEAPVPFAGLMLPAPQAALINGVAAHALDYDDVALSAHTSTVLVPAILAEGHRLDVSGVEALRAYVVGYEVWAELFTRESDQYHLKGWHPTGVFGPVAAAAAVAYLNRLTHDETRQALAIAASMAAGLVVNFGTMTKPFHAGRAAAAGIEAVRLSKLGLTSSPDVFEHRAGYLTALSPAGRVDRERPAEMGRTLRILDNGLSVKGYPVCYSGHRVIDGVLDITVRENILPAQVRRVRVTIGPAQASMLRNHRPQTGLEAKFSIEFAIAAALVERKVGLSQLTDGFVVRDDVRALMEKIETDITDQPDLQDPAFSFADRVVIELTDGRSFDSGDIRFARGSAKLPLTGQQLRGKFLDCLKTASLPAYQLPGSDTALYDRIAQLQRLQSLRALFG